MEEHLVQSHLGGYYISDMEPEIIERYCETCGDYDCIMTSWNEFEENARLNALLKYFMSNSLNTKKDLDRSYYEYSDCSLTSKEIINNIIDDIKYSSEEINNIITALFDDHDINEEEYKRISYVSKINGERQIKMVKHFAKSYVSNSSKVLKLKTNLKRNK